MDSYDYISPTFPNHLDPWPHFPNTKAGDPREIRDEGYFDPHRWYYDKFSRSAASVNIDEAHLLHNLAKQFEGKIGLEVGSYVGFSAWFILKAGLKGLAMCDPLLGNPKIRSYVQERLTGLPILPFGLGSPDGVLELAQQMGSPWSFVFIDGTHEPPYPLIDTSAVHYCCAEDAAIVFHDVMYSSVADCLTMLRAFGWNTRVYQTSMIMGAAWRGNVEPVDHIPDQAVLDLPIPDHVRALM